MPCIDVFPDVCLNKWLNKQWSCQLFETPCWSCDVTVTKSSLGLLFTLPLVAELINQEIRLPHTDRAIFTRDNVPGKYHTCWEDSKPLGAAVIFGYPHSAFKPFTSGRFGCVLKLGFLKLLSGIDIWSISCENALRWMLKDLTDDQSTLVQVMV